MNKTIFEGTINGTVYNNVNDYNKLLYIVIEPYSRKYGISFIEYSEDIDLDDIDSIISPLNLNQEVNHILNDIFDGKGIDWDKKANDAYNQYDISADKKDIKIVFPFINVPQEWINDFLVIFLFAPFKPK